MIFTGALAKKCRTICNVFTIDSYDDLKLDLSFMSPTEFKNWRKRCGLTQEQAAKKLGLKKRIPQYYENGKRDGKDFEIPKTTELACYAISVGVTQYSGPLIADD